MNGRKGYAHRDVIGNAAKVMLFGPDWRGINRLS